MVPEMEQSEDLLTSEDGLVVTPRVLLVSGEQVALVRHTTTQWLGLPGGKVKQNEIDGNLIGPGALPTLTREVTEECGRAPSFIFGINILPLGIAEVNAINETERYLTLYLTPVFISKSPASVQYNNNVVFINPHNPLPSNLYPDARISIDAFIEKRLWWLNRDAVYFQTHPTPMYLAGPPVWITEFA